MGDKARGKEAAGACRAGLGGDTPRPRVSWSQAMPPPPPETRDVDCGPGEAWLVSVMLGCQERRGACRLGICAHFREMGWSVPTGTQTALPHAATIPWVS